MMNFHSKQKDSLSGTHSASYSTSDTMAAATVGEVAQCIWNELPARDDRGTVYHDHFTLLKAALSADVIRDGSVSLQPRLTSQIRLRRWISQGTAELQETSGAGSFSACFITADRLIQATLGLVQSINWAKEDTMILLSELKKKKKILLEPNKKWRNQR